MEVNLAVANIVIQIAGMVFTWRRVERPGDRRLAYMLCGVALIATVAGLVWYIVAANGIDASPALVWLLYVAGGLVVLLGIGAALRGGGATRFAWRQGRYQRYQRQYQNWRRIP